MRGPRVGDREQASVTPSPEVEQRDLRLSMFVAVCVAALGIVWGASAGSQIMLFDGVYALLGVALTFLSLRISHLVLAGATDRYPFGREALVPLVVLLQGVALLGTCVYASFDAVSTILGGGSDTPAGAVTVYGAVTFAASLLVYLRLRRDREQSDLLAAEATQWLAGAALSLGLLVAFGGVLLLEGTSLERVGLYADPVMVLVACVSFLPAPYLMIRSTLSELLEGAPGAEVRAEVDVAIAEVCEQFRLDPPRVRMTKVGAKLYVEIDFVVDAHSRDIGDADDVRHALADRLDALPYSLWLNIELSADPHWSD